MEDDMLTGTSDAAFRADRVLRCIDIIKEKIKELPILKRAGDRRQSKSRERI